LEAVNLVVVVQGKTFEKQRKKSGVTYMDVRS